MCLGVDLFVFSNEPAQLFGSSYSNANNNYLHVTPTAPLTCAMQLLVHSLCADVNARGDVEPCRALAAFTHYLSVSTW